jgi:hypothetical protein
MVPPERIQASAQVVGESTNRVVEAHASSTAENGWLSEAEATALTRACGPALAHGVRSLLLTVLVEQACRPAAADIAAMLDEVLANM